jgi:hypothetical protein
MGVPLLLRKQTCSDDGRESPQRLYNSYHNYEATSFRQRRPLRRAARKLIFDFLRFGGYHTETQLVCPDWNVAVEEFPSNRYFLVRYLSRPKLDHNSIELSRSNLAVLVQDPCVAALRVAAGFVASCTTT